MTVNPFPLIVSPYTLAICRLDANEPLPDWVWSGAFTSITRTEAELSIVCPQANVPDGIRCERGWRCLRVAGTLDFSLVGVLAALVQPLANAGISVFAISTFDTDYLLVKDADLPAAIRTLEANGHLVSHFLDES